MDNDIQRLPSLLSEEKELVRETFYRFANEEVTPLAEQIHRFDEDIPDSILQGAAELGCFRYVYTGTVRRTPAR